MLNKKVEEALNAQINAEMWSAYLYLSMAAYAHANGNPGIGNWFQVQFREELDHAKILFNYVIQRNGRVDLKAIDAVPTTWDSPLAVFEATLAHEQKVTSLINSLLALATAENDFATQSMLKWFVDEQVEEEENAHNIIDNLKMVKDNGYGLYVLDKDLIARTDFQAPPWVGKEEAKLIRGNTKGPQAFLLLGATRVFGGLSHSEPHAHLAVYHAVVMLV